MLRRHRRRSRTSTAAASWSSPTGPASPAGATSPASSGSPPSGSASTASRTSSSCAPSSATCVDERFYADLDADQQRLATMSMLVPPQMLNTMVPDRAPDTDVVLRRPDPALHDPGRLRPPHRLAVAPVRHPRLAARARHVGGRGPHPPLPDQGARRAAVHLPAVLRPLHPDGPGRQLHPHVDKLKLDPQAGRPLRRPHRLPARPTPACATSSSPAATWPTCRGSNLESYLMRLLDIETIRDIRLATKALMRPAPALAAARRRRGPGAGRPHRRPPRRQPRHPHPRQPRPVGDPAGRQGRPDRARRRRPRRAQPGRAHARRQRHHARPARPVLRAAGRGRHPAVLLLHVRHDPQRRALAGRRSGRPSSCSTTSWATCPATPPRGSSATCRSSASAGCTCSPSTTASTASRTGPRTTAPRSRPPTPRRSTKRYAYYDPIDTLPEAGQQWWAEHRND